MVTKKLAMTNSEMMLKVLVLIPSFPPLDMVGSSSMT
jgi:hypothetical protein